MQIASLLLPLATLVALAGTPATAAGAPAHACGNPCLQAARDARRDCASTAGDAFTEAIGGCLQRNHECVDACRSGRQDCLDATDVAAQLALCALEVTARKQRCRDRYPVGSRLRANCIYRAESAGFRCRARVRRRTRRDVLQCGAAFHQCGQACAPGGPPQGVKACRAEGKAARRAALADCQLTFLVTGSACINRDVTCVQACADARDACNAPTQATRDAALAACKAQEASALAACRATNPGGGASLQDCARMAQADALACRSAALQAAAPGFAACTLQYLGCVRGCPRP